MHPKIQKKKKRYMKNPRAEEKIHENRKEPEVIVEKKEEDAITNTNVEALVNINQGIEAEIKKNQEIINTNITAEDAKEKEKGLGNTDSQTLNEDSTIKEKEAKEPQ